MTVPSTSVWNTYNPEEWLGIAVGCSPCNRDGTGGIIYLLVVEEEPVIGCWERVGIAELRGKTLGGAMWEQRTIRLR